MTYEWDEKKNAQNIIKHGFDFADASLIDWGDAVIFEDVRQDYDETRFIAYGYMGARLTVTVYTMRGDSMRIISLRKANQREVKRHENNWN